MLGSSGISSTNAVGFGRSQPAWGRDNTPESYDDKLKYVLLQLGDIDFQYRNPSDFPGSLPLIRLTPANYSDGFSAPPTGLPNPRDISNAIFAQSLNIDNPVNCTDIFWLWGQFIDHDLDLTPGHSPTEALNIPIPSGDPQFDPESTGTVELSFQRSIYDTETGTTNARQQFTQITYELDASGVYGSSEARSNWLRATEGGGLKMGQNNLLPIGVPGDMDNAGDPGKNIFVAGDVRANENILLTSLHTVFAREHNWWVAKIKATNNDLTDDELYQKARVMVESEIQAITYREFLPLLLGEGAIPEYTGYKSEVSTAVSNEFSTAAYRLGHSLVSETLWRLNNDGTLPSVGHISLRDAFFAPDEFTNECDLSKLIRGAAKHPCQKLDSKIVDSLRNFLFGQPGSGGLDLASLNIQRGRDHGLSGYNAARVALGLGARSSFAEITSNSEIASALSSVYSDDLDKIDFWVGGLCEDPVEGSQLGELFQYVIVDQFTRTRDGDENFYLNRLTDRQIDLVHNTTLAKILRRNTEVRNIQNRVMVL